jgi:hypothetical protein
MPDGGTQVEISSLGAEAPATTALLAMWNVSAPGPDQIADRVLRASIPASGTSGTKVQLSRCQGNAGRCSSTTIPYAAFERINFGPLAKVQYVDATMDAGVGSLNVPITPVDTTRAFVLSTSQSANGQGLGESDLSTPGSDIIGDAVARFSFLDSQTVRLQRSSSVGTSTWTFMVIEIQP